MTISMVMPKEQHKHTNESQELDDRFLHEIQEHPYKKKSGLLFN